MSSHRLSGVPLICSECEKEFEKSTGFYGLCCGWHSCLNFICTECLEKPMDDSPRLQDGKVRCWKHREHCAECGISFEKTEAKYIGTLTLCSVCPSEVRQGADGRRIVRCERCGDVEEKAQCKELDGQLYCLLCSEVTAEIQKEAVVAA